MSDAWKTFGITIIVLLAIISAFLIASYISRECNTNPDCNENQYCAYNNKCYSCPNIQPKYSNLLSSALVLGIAIVIAALILKGKLNNK